MFSRRSFLKFLGISPAVVPLIAQSEEIPEEPKKVYKPPPPKAPFPPAGKSTIEKDFKLFPNGDIRWVGGKTQRSYTVAEFHVHLTDRTDADFTLPHISHRITENRIAINVPRYNIDDEVARHLRDGTVIQGKEIWDCIIVIGTVSTSDSEIHIFKDGNEHINNHWGFVNSDNEFNDDSKNMLANVLVKRVNTDGKALYKSLNVVCKEPGDTYGSYVIPSDWLHPSGDVIVAAIFTQTDWSQ